MAQNETKQNHQPFYQTTVDYNVKENGLFIVIGHIVRFSLSDCLEKWITQRYSNMHIRKFKVTFASTNVDKLRLFVG